MGQSAPEGAHRQGADVLGAQGLAVGQPEAQSIPQVDEVDSQRDVELQADCRCAIVGGASHVEHDAHDLFVSETDDVVKGPATLDGEVLARRVGQVQRGHPVQDGPETTGHRGIENPCRLVPCEFPERFRRTIDHRAVFGH